MASESSKSLVIISAGVEQLPLLQNFLDANVALSVILNTTGDFTLLDDGNSDKSKEVWYHHEIVKLANSFVPDDFAESSLARIFTKPITESRVSLTDAERFLIQWVSEQHKANQDFTDFFKALSEYSNKSINVYPLKFPETIIELKSEDHLVPLRFYQITGFIDRNAEDKTDLEELQTLFNETKDTKGKKKVKPKIEIVGLDKKRDILTEQTKKTIEDADAIILLGGDPCSLAILLLHNEFTRAVRESKAPATLVCPTRFSFREQFILEMLSVKPTLLGLAELCSGVVDHLVVGPDDAGEVKTLRAQGFNVLMEDLTKIKDSQGLLAILKGLGISLSEISVKRTEVDHKQSLEELVTQLTYSQVDEKPSEDFADSVEEAETTTEITESGELIHNDKPPHSVDLQDTTKRNYHFEDPSLMLTQEMIESLMQELSEEFPNANGAQKALIERMAKEKVAASTPLDPQEDFTNIIDTLINLEDYTNQTDLIQQITEAVTKNADMAGYAAKKLTLALESAKGTGQFVAIYLSFTKPRPLIFVKEMVDWLVKNIDSPDYVSFAQKALIVTKMNRNDNQFVGQVLEQLVSYRMTQPLAPKEKEYLRTLIGMITIREVTLQRQAIRAYLSHYDTVKKSDDVWLGLLKYDAALVALEIIEHQSKNSVKIVQDALTRNLGSYGHIIYDVFASYQKGDIQSVLATAGALSEGLVRKQKRVELAEKIAKFGSVPLETLAKSVDIEPQEFETLVYEMINENEINAKIEVVEGRLCIVQLEEQSEEED
ncbi:MAG: PCI domain-containing protein [Candidatus Hodarchaeales archaeon]|jgi:hypothetical protein